MFKRLSVLFIICGFCLSVTACGPSEEKVAQAQQKYAQLTAINNQVVEAHNNVTDNSLDEELIKLREQVREVETYNLNEMKDEEIDMLIQIMDSLIASYEKFHVTLNNIKAEEEAAVLVPIPVTVVNETGFAISSVKLHEKGDYSNQVNVLDGFTSLEQGQTMTGLMVQRDVDETPWILELVNAEGVKYELTLPVAEYTEEGVTLHLTYDAAEEKVTINGEGV